MERDTSGWGRIGMGGGHIGMGDTSREMPPFLPPPLPQTACRHLLSLENVSVGPGEVDVPLIAKLPVKYTLSPRTTPLPLPLPPPPHTSPYIRGQTRVMSPAPV